MQFSRDIPFAKFQAWKKYISNLNDDGGEVGTSTRHNNQQSNPRVQARGRSGRDVVHYEF